MASPNCCSQLSQDGKYLAYCGNDGKLKIWETATSRLKQEYIPNLHLSSPCSVLAWISVTRRSNINSNSPWNKRRRKSVAEEGEEAGMVAMGSVNGDVILYDVAAGSVSKQLQNGHAGVVTAIDWSETSGLFTAAKDRQIVEWNVKKNGIKSKWKSGKEKITSIVILQDGNSLISASRSIKWWDLATKRLIMSFAGHASLITSLNPVVINGESCYLISGASGDRQLNVWSLNKENMDKTSVGILAMQDEAVSVSTHVSEDSGMEVLAITRLGRAQLFKQQSNGRSSKPLKPALNVVVETSRGAKKSIQPIQILTAKLTEDSKLLLAYGSYLNITFERVTPDFTDKLQHLLRAETKKLREKNELGISKLKATSVDRDVEYPVTTTSRTAVKRSRMSDAGSQLPMEVRLGNLSLKTAANTPDETPTKVTSMAQLLMQGLHSKDKAILRDVLLTQDETMVKNTVARLPIETIAPLLKELTAMLQGRTQSTRIAITWLKMMVQTFAGHLLSYPDLGDLLEPILGTVDAKLNLLPELCRLKGRVALLTGQISQASQKQDKINEESLLIYQDSDGKKSPLKAKRRNTSNMSLTEIPSPVKKKPVSECDVSDERIRLEGRMKSKKLLVEVDSRSDSSSISVQVLNSRHEVSKKEKNHKKTQKVERKKPNTLLSMVHDSSDSSESDDGHKKIAGNSAKSLNETNLKRSESRVRQATITSDEEEEHQSSDKRLLRNVFSTSEAEQTLDNYWLKDQTSKENCLKDRGKSVELGETFVSLSKPDKTASRNQTKPRKSNKNCSNDKHENSKVREMLNSGNVSVNDLKSGPDLLTKERKQKVEIMKSNPLLSTIDDSSSNSDHNDEGIKIEDDPDDTVSTKNLPKRIESEIRNIYTTSDDENENQFSDTQRWTNPLGHPLKVEAEDIEHLISVLNDENEVPPKTLKKLKKLRVILQHKVPPQHMVESCAGSRGPTHEQKDIIKKFGPIKCGKYTPDEDKVIVKNWKSFCRVHDWDARDIKAFLYMRHPHSKYTAKLSQRQKFVQYLANGLPWRTLYSVYYRFRNLYQPHSATRYTEDEDGLIIAHMEKNSSTDTRNVRKFSELGKILHRTRASVWRRYRLLKKRRNPDQNHRRLFGYAETTQPLTLSKDVHELKDLDIPLAVWNKLSEKFEIDHKELKQFWHTKLHMQLFCKKSVYLNDVKINLYVSGIKERWEIEWDKITKVFDGMTSLFLSSIFNNVVYDERLEGKELGEILEHSHQVKKPRLRQAATDECLPKLVFKHGSLIVFDLDKKRIRYFDSTLSMLKNNHDNNCY